MNFPHRKWNFDIDRYLNPFVPPPPWKHLPYPVARFLGHRETKPQVTGNLMHIFWTFIGVFVAILLIEGVSKHVPSFESHGAPMIVGSFGAAAVLEFHSIEAPLAQPRNAVFGQIISTFIGVSVAKLFQLSHRFEDIQWYGGALACASATALMALTKTVHPPAGATALLAVIDATLVKMGWFLFPVMLLGCALMLGAALLINNIERRFPMYWWTPQDLRSNRRHVLRRGKSDELKKKALDEEKGVGSPEPDAGAASQSTQRGDEDQFRETDKDEARASQLNFTRTHQHLGHLGEIVIRRGEVVVPHHMFLTQEEEQLLETMSHRL